MPRLIPDLPDKGEAVPPAPTQPIIGEDSVPSLRFIILADGGNTIQLIDETADVVSGFWESPTLNRTEAGQQAVWTLKKLLLYYSANDDVRVLLQTTGDGGRIWSETIGWDLKAGRGAIKSSLKGVNQTGFDLRFRLGFRNKRPVSILAYRPTLIERAILVGAGK